jgi:enterochelin esterase-like enzyme
MLKKIYHRLRRSTRILYNSWSPALGRKVKVEVLLPPTYWKQPSETFPVICFNDGQDFPALNLYQTLAEGYATDAFPPYIIVGLHTDKNRTFEYGTLEKTHYQGYGNKALDYTRFVTNELVPFLKNEFRCRPEVSAWAMAGFSLGGLSAFDIAWNNPDIFGRIGAFSASFWWRWKTSTPEDPDAGRVVHETVLGSEKREGMRFWFEVGTNDETDDRNNNGIIDSIDDTRDLINCLLQIGYDESDITYLEVEGGEHNQATWGAVLPAFLSEGK